jgi:phage N-6-adenine-methyltransferase
MNTDVMFSSADTVWETDDPFYQMLHAEFGFTLDPCCTHENAKCDIHFTPAEDGLKQDWGKHVFFMNPPYGDPEHPCGDAAKCKKKKCLDRAARAATGLADAKKAWAKLEEDEVAAAEFALMRQDPQYHVQEYVPGIIDWMKKALDATKNGASGVCLVPNRSETAWYVENVADWASEVRTVIGRLRFKNRATGKNDSAPFPSIVIVFRHEDVKRALESGQPVNTLLKTQKQPHHLAKQEVAA